MLLQSAELSAKLVSKDAEIRSQKERCGELEKAMADLTRRVEEKEEVVVSQVGRPTYNLSF